MAFTAQWQATTCADLLTEAAPIIRVLPGGYRRTIGRIIWTTDRPESGAQPLITLTEPATLDGDDLGNLSRLIYDAYAAAYAVVFDDACDAWENSPEAAAARADLDAGTPPAETCILPAAWDPTAAITLVGRDSLDDALTQAAADTADEWVPVHTAKPWTVAWAHI